jgi:hypothetical protein
MKVITVMEVTCCVLALYSLLYLAPALLPTIQTISNITPSVIVRASSSSRLHFRRVVHETCDWLLHMSVGRCGVSQGKRISAARGTLNLPVNHHTTRSRVSRELDSHCL